MDKEEYYRDQIELFKKIYPEKTEEDIKRMVDKTYTKFKDIIDDM